MEYIKHILTILSFIVAVQFTMNDCQQISSNDAGQSKEEELRSMLNTVLEQNRRLMLQNERLQQVWFGLEQMCKALSVQPCDCGPDNTNNQPTDPPTKHVAPLHMMSIKSSGIDTNQTTISIKYAATPDHTTEWVVFQGNDGMWRTVGQRTKDKYDPVVYTSTIDVLHLEYIRHIHFRLFNNNESLNVRLNMTALETNQEQNISKLDVDLLKINKSFVAPRDTDLVISSIVYRDPREFHELENVEVFFTGVNTSVSPPAIFEIFQFGPDGLAVKGGRHADTTSYMNITLRQPYVQYGGILFVRMSYIDKNASMVQRTLYGPSIRIYGPDGKNIVQNNAVGMFPLDAQTIVSSLNHSIMCAAMGDPRPDVSVFKMTKNGKKTEMATETVILDNYMNVKVMTLSASQTKQIEGQYLCQATNGNQTMNATTDVVVLEPAMFDDAKTGVMKNTSQSIVISCKAKGSPRPHLELKLYEEYGPDLVKSGMYKFRRSSPNTFTTRVTLTISSVDDSDIHTVYCVSTQGGPSRPYEDSKPIYVYPGVQKRYNWDLYDRVFNATQKAYIAV